MVNNIFTETVINISELKSNPMKAVASGHGLPVAVLNRNKTTFYCIPAKTYEQMIDKLADLELLIIAEEREKHLVAQKKPNKLKPKN